MELSVAGMLVVPEMCVHDFTWSPGSKGHVLFIAKPLLVQRDQLLGTVHWGVRSPAYYQLGEDHQFIAQFFSAILGEYQQAKGNRDLMLESLVRTLCI